jgi:hypothetical protein
MTKQNESKTKAIALGQTHVAAYWRARKAIEDQGPRFAHAGRHSVPQAPLSPFEATLFDKTLASYRAHQGYQLHVEHILGIRIAEHADAITWNHRHELEPQA